MIPVKKRWTETSRLYKLADSRDGRRRFSLDVGIAWQNYKDGKGIFQEIDLTPEISDLPGFDLMVRKAPYILHVGLDGSRRIYPDRNDKARYLDFPVPSILAGKTMLAGSRNLLSEGTDYDVEIGWENSRITFDTILNKSVSFDSISFPVLQTGITDDELRILLGKPKVYEMDGFESREMEVSLKNGLISLGFDLTGMKFPVVVDPTLDLQPGASGDDGSNRTGSFSSGSILLLVGATTDPVSWSCFMRIPNVTIPNADTVDVANLTFTGRAGNSGVVVRTNIYAHKSDDAVAPTSEAEFDTIVASELTTNFAVWDGLGAWVLDAEFTSPSIVSPVQEIVDQGGWSSGNAMQFLWLDDGSDTTADTRRRPYSYDGDTAKAVKFHAEYTEAAAAGGFSHKKRSTMLQGYEV